MKYLVLIFFMLVLIACKTGEGIDNERSNIRMDGFYMGKNLYASTSPDTVNGKLVPRNVMELLRFYSLDSGVIIHETVAANFVMTDSANRLYYNWCREYQNKNPADKDFVNFKFRLYSRDSIRFTQNAPGIKIDFAGCIYKDSVLLNYSMHPVGIDAMGGAPARLVGLKFYPVKQ